MSTPTPATPEEVRQRHAAAQRDNAQRAALIIASAFSAAKAGDLPPNDLRPLLKGVIGQAMHVARRLADVAVAAELSVTAGRPVLPVGLPEDPTVEGTVALGVDTILNEEAAQLAQLLDAPEELDDDAAALTSSEDDAADGDHSDNVVDLAEFRARRLAANAALEAGQRSTQEALEAQGVEYWKREARPGACQLCRALADGKVIPLTKTMVVHPGCSCTMQPTTENGQPLDAENFQPVRVADLPTVKPERTFTTGHGLGRKAYEHLPSGFRIERSAPQTRPASEWRRSGDPRRRTPRKPQ